MRLRVAICEDEKAQSNLLNHYLKVWSDENEHNVTCDFFGSGEEFMYRIREYDVFYSLIILDISLGGNVNGYSLCHEIKSINLAAPIVFITSSTRSYQQARDLGAFDYILKPFELADVTKIMQQVVMRRSVFNDDVFEVRIKNNFTESPRILIISYCDVMYLTKRNNYICINNNDLLLVRDTFERVKKNSGFLLAQPSNGFLVNLTLVKWFNFDVLIMQDGSTIPISKRFSKNFHSDLTLFLANYTHHKVK